MIVHVTDQDLITQMWPALEILFRRVIPSTNGCYEVDDILTEIRNGTQQLWVAWDNERKIVDAAMTTMLVDRPRKKVCIVPFIAGSRMRTWKDEFMECLDKFARAEGASLIEGYFREGWERIWTGCRKHGVCLVRELA